MKNTQRSPGRPPVDADDKSIKVGVSLPSKQYDDLVRRALADDCSVPEIIRRDLKRDRE